MGSEETFGEAADYGALSFEAVGAKQPSRRTKKMGKLGTSFLGLFRR